MVKSLTAEDHTVIDAALKQAVHKTSAQIGVTVRAASASYHACALLYGLLFGSMLAATLYCFQITQNIEILLAIQLGSTLLCDILHNATGLFACVAPRRVKRRLAAQEAMHAYAAQHAHLPQNKPFVLLFVSQAERYVHVVTNPIVHARIPDDWHRVTDALTQTIRRSGLRDACTEAVDQIAAILAPHFPP